MRQITDAFLTRYHARYHHSNAGVPVELDHVRVAVRGPAPQVVLPETATATASADSALKGHRQVYLPERGGFEPCRVYDRYRLTAGTTLSGPAIVEENESTVVLGVGAQGQIDRYGNLVVTLPATASVASDAAVSVGS
jgi:N-methylhydantoinase A/oxoprolinase/acetone carboxylase beta subunit